MKSPPAVLALLAASAFLAASCGRGNDVPVPNADPASTKGGAAGTVSTGVPQVAPVVPKGAEAPTPAPGQANDHSSPGFKSGGKTDPSK